MEVDRNGLEVLDRSQCLELLATATLGRIAITVAALPVVLPINFRLVDDQVVFRTNEGSKLDAATSGAVVAFEADHFDSLAHEGWSVVVTGIAREVTDAAEHAALTALGIPHWTPVGGDRIVSVSTDMVTGRRLVHGLTGPAAA